jgi:hypothetical protein
MGIWNSLTIQGKLAIAAAVLGGLFLLTLAYGDNSGANNEGPGFTTTSVNPQAALFATSTPTFKIEVPTAVGSPAATPTQPPAATETPAAAPPTATRPAVANTPRPTATAVIEEVVEEPPPPPPEPTTPPPPPPTATSATGCRVAASVSGTSTVTGTITCAGAVGAGVPMTATFNFANLSSGCSGLANASGTASCTANLDSADPGALRSVDVCMTSTTGRVCTTAN